MGGSYYAVGPSLAGGILGSRSRFDLHEGQVCSAKADARGVSFRTRFHSAAGNLEGPAIAFIWSGNERRRIGIIRSQMLPLHFVQNIGMRSRANTIAPIELCQIERLVGTFNQAERTFAACQMCDPD